ncbi:hypothetical protein CR513_40910, partial [Mucuna pruriens]
MHSSGSFEVIQSFLVGSLSNRVMTWLGAAVPLVPSKVRLLHQSLSLTLVFAEQGTFGAPSKEPSGNNFEGGSKMKLVWNQKFPLADVIDQHLVALSDDDKVNALGLIGTCKGLEA